MSSQFEPYLRRVEKHLKGLSTSEKELQLLEISQHLEILMAGQHAAGLSEAEAVEFATRKFGHPEDVGRDIAEATGGQKTGLLKGMLLGTVVGIAVLATPSLIVLCISGGLIQTARDGFLWGIYAPSVVIAGFSGALSSLVGRHFAKRYLNRPTRSLPVSQAASHGLRLGLWRGTIGGSIFSIIHLYQSQQSGMWVKQPNILELVHSFAIITLATTLIFGCLNSASSFS
ncbi:MAG: hypothetical protein EOP10_35170 [Proteobacteria bacterium]|nr:MAG: hypothetical protein EOP10_35170 [Pseudomonadota bacterium]